MYGKKAKIVQRIESIFERNGKKYSNNALLYQDILRYSMQLPRTSPTMIDVHGFTERQLAKWLIAHHKEYVEYYTDSKANTPINVRIAYRLPRIKEKIRHLINFGLIRQVKTKPASTVNIDIPVYSLTVSGNFLACLLETESTEIEFKTRALNQLFRIIESYLKSKENSRASFLLQFFINCRLHDCFLDSYALPIDSRRLVHNEFSVLEIFLDMKNVIYWVLTKPQIFEDAFKSLADYDKKAMLFQFKFQIEDYYNNEYASKKWEKMRYENISEYTSVAVPGYCSRCHSNVPFLYETIEYLRSMSTMLRPHPSGLVWANCPDCGRDSASGHIMSLPSPWKMLEYYGGKPFTSFAD
jgi:hypothetical protein